MLKSLFVVLALSASAAGIAAEPTAPLERYLDGLTSLRADFRQTLFDAGNNELQQAGGRLLVLRPGRFRWEVNAPEGGGRMMVVADGRNLWFYDEDLEQVTVKPASSALSATPAMLLTGVGDVHGAFEIKALPRKLGLDWIEVSPRAADADFRTARLGFDERELRRMELLDKLGQTAKLVFSRIERNAPVSVEEVSFTPPPGADVIGQPAP